MPNSPAPVGAYGNRPALWNTVLQAIQGTQLGLNQLKAGTTQGPNIVDMWGNTNEVAGTNLNQVVIIGSSHLQPGVWVATNIGTASVPLSGRAGATGLKTPTITLTAGSTSATVSSGTGLSNGMVLGALSVAPGVTSAYVQGLTPGTYIAGITGTSVTLSQNALVSGTGLFSAAITWTQLTTY